MLRIPLLLLLLLNAGAGLAQNNAYNVGQPGGGSVVYKVQPELRAYLAMMDSLDAKGLKSYGYRIQLFSASGANAKKNALQSQSAFLQVYGSMPSYTLWSYPNWVVRVGDFRTRLEALEFHMEIRERYPASFIIKDEVVLEYR